MPRLLKVINKADINTARKDPVDTKTIEAAREIVEAVRDRGEAAVRQYAEQFNEVEIGEPLIADRRDLERALDTVPNETRDLLESAAARVRAFAEGQRNALQDFKTDVVLVPELEKIGGTMGHQLVPVERAGCYAPGGRYPLPSSVIMTAVTARAAGVEHITVATPSNDPVMLAAAAVSGADQLLRAGGAHAIAAFAYGAGVLQADAIVGPGNRFVTAAKQLVAGRVAIDMLAGPSEVLILADDSADPETVAADLLAQAEHDTDAAALLVTTSPDLAEAVEQQLQKQIADLPTRDTAQAALVNNSFACIVSSETELIELADALAPEHLEVITKNADDLSARLKHAGALFIGHGAAEAVGDYGVGPNHTLPTGGSARAFAGLSVMTFLRMRTFINIHEPAHPDLYRQTAALARLEGLEAHARSAEQRLRP